MLSRSHAVGRARLAPATRTPISAFTRRVVVPRAKKSDQKPEEPKAPSEEPKAQTRTEKILEELKATGMNTAKAREILNTWKKAGIKDAVSLRKLLVKRSLQPLTGLTIQLFLDTIASAGGWYIGSLAQEANDLPFAFVVQLLGYFFGIYYSIQILFELTVIASILYSTFRYNTSSSELLLAVQSLAGPGTGVSVVDQATRVVNTLKVLQVLEELNAQLKETYGSGAPPEAPGSSSLRNLSALLALSYAKEAYGFDPEQYGLTEKQAGDIAYAFATYDLNDNGKLELYELGKLCEALGRPLESPELEEAMRVLDTNKSRSIELNEFTAWWISSGNAVRKDTPASQ